MFEPDLGYYLRALRARWWLVVLGAGVGVLLGVSAGSVQSGGQWRVAEMVRIQNVALPSDFDELVTFALPERDVLSEAALIRVIASELAPGAAVSVSADELAGTIRVTASDSSRSAALADANLVLELYRADRADDFARYIDEALKALDSLSRTTQDALDQIGTDVSTAGVAAEPSDLIATLASARAASEYLMDLRDGQTGGLASFSEPEFSRLPPTGTGLTFGAVLGVLGALTGAVVALVVRTRRRRIESAADLALFPAIVSVGAIDELQPRLLQKLAPDVSTGASGSVIITETLVGTSGEQLRDAFAAHGIDASVHGCLRLPTVGATDTVVVAVDRAADTEQTVDDLLDLVRGVSSRPLLAVLC